MIYFRGHRIIPDRSSRRRGDMPNSERSHTAILDMLGEQFSRH
jgi:hypothetical protein